MNPKSYTVLALLLMVPSALADKAVDRRADVHCAALGTYAHMSSIPRGATYDRINVVAAESYTKLKVAWGDEQAELVVSYASATMSDLAKMDIGFDTEALIQFCAQR